MVWYKKTKIDGKDVLFVVSDAALDLFDNPFQELMDDYTRLQAPDLWLVKLKEPMPIDDVLQYYLNGVDEDYEGDYYTIVRIDDYTYVIAGESVMIPDDKIADEKYYHSDFSVDELVKEVS